MQRSGSEEVIKICNLQPFKARPIHNMTHLVVNWCWCMSFKHGTPHMNILTSGMHQRNCISHLKLVMHVVSTRGPYAIRPQSQNAENTVGKIENEQEMQLRGTGT